jgi:methyltransferase (TIGR00027 family)
VQLEDLDVTPSRDDRMDPVAETARWTAAERARESARPDRLFDDPLAAALAGKEGLALAERMRRDGVFDNPGFAVRTRYFDDVILNSVSVRGSPLQVVDVAAGMDARPYRLTLPADLVWYELDQPELLALKERVLTEVGARPRCARRAVGVDLTTEWAGPLCAAGFDPARPAVWLLEGLLPYLTPAAVYRLLDVITELSASGSELLADTIGQSILDTPRMRPLHDRLAEEGTSWQFGTDEPEDELFAPRGWRADASLISEIGTRLGRWPWPTTPRGTPNTPQSFLVHAAR